MSKKRNDAPSQPHWDVVFEQGDARLKARVHIYQTRDGMAKRALETQLALRFPDAPADAAPVDADVEGLFLINNFPLMRYGIEAAEGFSLPLTEEAFWKLPEAFMLELSEAIRKANPQYAIPFVELRRLIGMLSGQNSEPTSTAIPPSESADKGN